MAKNRRKKLKNQIIGWSVIVLILIIIFLIIWGFVSLIGLLFKSSGSKEGGPCIYPEPQKIESVNLVEYTGRVEHIFFHPVVAYPELAFDGDYMAQGFDDWFVTSEEFKKVIQSLYDNNFILVGPDSFYEVTDSGYKYKKLMLPEGKKPIFISLDDMNYYTYMIENGTVSRLVFDENGNVAALCNENGNEIIRRDNCIIPILDDFVKLHPDFSFNGAKACIGLTGFEGILGYRTHADSPNREQEIKAVTPIIKRLKDTGWTFASHSYGHYDVAAMSAESLTTDCEEWKNEVQSIIGETNVYLYPYGSGVANDDPKFDILTSYGFTFMSCVGIESYIEYYDDGVQMDRRHVDGVAFRLQREANLDLYDANNIIDLNARD